MSNHLQNESEKEAKNRILQKNLLDKIQKQYKLSEMETVFLCESKDDHHHFIDSIFIPISYKEKALSDLAWNLNSDNSKPRIESFYSGESKYLRFGNQEGLEPLVISRNFNDLKPSYIEISEEFRLFYNLYLDETKKSYIRFDDDGNSKIIITFSENEVKIRLKELLQFLAAKSMYLLIQYDCREHTPYSIDKLMLTKGVLESNLKSNGKSNYIYEIYCGDCMGNDTFTRLSAKKILLPFIPSSVSKSKKYQDFIIDIDAQGDDITFTCNPDELADFFGKNPDSPNYLTPVCFEKKVLEKYYLEPTKYRVEDSHLYCGSLWSLSIDNNHDDYVQVWLGDLGGLPEKEQIYWRSFNIQNIGKVSNTYLKRQIMAEFTDSDYPDHIFKAKYLKLLEKSLKLLNWHILLPLAEKDKPYLDELHMLTVEEQHKFDILVLALTKILIDSINEKRINELLDTQELVNLKGSISKLEALLKRCNIEDNILSSQIFFLRKLQNLRSASSAHRKGSNFDKISKEFNIDKLGLMGVSKLILNDSIKFLNFLDVFINKYYESFSKP